MEHTQTRSQFSKSLENIRMSPIVSISEEAKVRAVEFEKSGRQFISFQRGEIDFPTPTYITDAVLEGLDLGLTKYPLKTLVLVYSQELFYSLNFSLVIDTSHRFLKIHLLLTPQFCLQTLICNSQEY